jgi:hypothetical protein
MAFLQRSGDRDYFYMGYYTGGNRHHKAWVYHTVDTLDTITTAGYFDDYTGQRPVPGDRIHVHEVTDRNDLSTIVQSYTLHVVDFDDGDFRTIEGDGPFKTEYGERYRSDKDRASDEVHISEFTGYDPTGDTALAHTAIASAWAAMIERGRSRVILGPGLHRLGEKLSLQKTYVDGTRCELVGSGYGVSAIIGPASTDHIIELGDETGVVQTGNIGFRDFLIASGAVQTGYAVAMEYCRNVLFEKIFLYLTASGFGLGPGTTDPDKKNLEIFIKDCSGRLKVNAGGAWVDLIAGEAVFLDGGRTTGREDQYFLNQSSNVANSDGIYIINHFSEQWGYAIRSDGDGLVNLRMDCNQFDRALHFIHVTSTATSSNRNWQVRCQFLGESASATEIQAACHFNASAGGIIEAITIYASAFDGRQGPVGRFIANPADPQGPYVNFVGNTIRDCGNGSGGVPLFEIGEAANPTFFGNHITQGLHAVANDPYTIAFNYDGASTGRRQTAAVVEANNLVLDFATSVTAGTP